MKSEQEKPTITTNSVAIVSPVNDRIQELFNLAIVQDEGNPVLQTCPYEDAAKAVKDLAFIICMSQGIKPENMPPTAVIQQLTDSIRLQHEPITAKELKLAYTLNNSSHIKVDCTLYGYFDITVVLNLISAYKSWRFKQNRNKDLPEKSMVKTPYFKTSDQFIEFLETVIRVITNKATEEERHHVNNHIIYSELGISMLDQQMISFPEVSLQDYLRAEYTARKAIVKQDKLSKGRFLREGSKELHDLTCAAVYRALFFTVMERYKDFTKQQLTENFKPLFPSLCQAH